MVVFVSFDMFQRFFLSNIYGTMLKMFNLLSIFCMCSGGSFNIPPNHLEPNNVNMKDDVFWVFFNFFFLFLSGFLIIFLFVISFV